jgi:hypothetical protein
MIRVVRSLLNPPLKQSFLRLRQGLFAAWWRHLHVIVFGHDPIDQFALRWLVWNDGGMSNRFCLNIQSQIGCTTTFIRPMAGIAMGRKNRPYLIRKIDQRIIGKRLCQKMIAQKQTRKETSPKQTIYENV